MLLLVHFDPNYYFGCEICSLIGPHKSAVVLFDRGYPSFGNVDSTIAIDVVGMKSYMFLKTRESRK